MRATPPRSRRDQFRLWLSLFAFGALSWSACSTDDDPSTQNLPPAAAGAIAPSSGGSAGHGSGGKSDSGTAGESSGGRSDGGQGGGSAGAPNTGGAATGGNASGGAASGGDASGGASSGGAATGGAATGGAATGGAATGGSSSGGPTIELWHDEKLEVGGPRAAGLPQGFANVLGRIGFSGSTLSASYRLNDGPSTSMPVGATATRLARRGDFNIELPIDSLLPYPAENRVRISATDPEGTVEHELSVFLRPTQVSTPSLDIDWSTLNDIAELDDMAAIVDGHWDLRASGVHVAELGYDRLIAVGDRSWPPNYEVVAEVTLHDFRNYGGLGIAIGWQGHTGTANPRTGWPLEALGWVRFRPDGPEAQLMTFTQNEIAGTPVTMTSGAAYVYKVRSDRLGNGLARFSLKFWPRGTSEPTDWVLQRDVPERAGSVLLVAHHTEATWETLRVTPTP